MRRARRARRTMERALILVRWSIWDIYYDWWMIRWLISDIYYDCWWMILRCRMKFRIAVSQMRTAIKRMLVRNRLRYYRFITTLEDLADFIEEQIDRDIAWELGLRAEDVRLLGL